MIDDWMAALVGVLIVLMALMFGAIGYLAGWEKAMQGCVTW